MGFDKHWQKGLESAITICRLPEIETPCGLTSGKRLPPVSDHISLTLLRFSPTISDNFTLLNVKPPLHVETFS